MVCNCGHAESDHILVSMCEEQIHYPSEDYPCFCTGYREAAGGKCAECGHALSAHVSHHVCRPSTGDFCTCRSFVRAVLR